MDEIIFSKHALKKNKNKKTTVFKYFAFRKAWMCVCFTVYYLLHKQAYI